MDEFTILNRGTTERQADQLSSKGLDTSKSVITAGQHEKKMRKVRRSQDLIEAVRQVDVQTDPAMKAAIIDWVNAEYEKRGGGKLIGLFSKCYLGHPYCDHRMDLAGTIVEHYQIGEEVPPAYASARPLAASNAYAYIEIYGDGEVIPVRFDGTV
jgi:hypothetical protein